MSSRFALPFAAQLLLPLAALLLLLFTHHKKSSLSSFHFSSFHFSLSSFPFTLSSFLFFFLLGLARGQQGDINLLPQSVYGSADHISGLVIERLHSLGLSREVTSLLDAMLMGQRQGLPHEMLQMYYTVGASHVLALSGLHLSILFGVFDYCLMRVLTYAPIRYTLGIIGLVTLWIYALITGLPVSLVRASVMMSLLLLSQMRLSGTDRWHTLGLAAMFILFFSPSSLWSVGFQLSFSAMAGLFLFYAPIRDLWNVNCWLFRWLWSGVVASFSAQVLVLPLLAYYFAQVSLYSIFLSPFYILLATLILYSGLLALVFGCGVASLVSFFVSVQHHLMRYATLLPGAVWGNLHTSLAQVVLQYMGIFCFVPLLSVLQPQYGDLLYQRLAYTLRRWPYIVACIPCFLFA